jgi:large subunit ribosomal protein L25
MTLTLTVEARDAVASIDALRARGKVPAVFYGPKEAPTAVTIDLLTFEKVWREAGETTLVKLVGPFGEKETLIQDVQRHPLTDKPLHADFYVLEKGKKVDIDVPLEFEGQAPAEKNGHILVKALHEIKIEVAPAELPHHLVVDVSTLENVGDHILAGQIKLPPSAELLTGADEIIVSVTAFEEEKPLETEFKPAEVIGEKKEGDEAAPTEEKKE